MTDALTAVNRWRRFAEETIFDWRGSRRSWARHVAGAGYVDERELIQPYVFPKFAQELLGFSVGSNLAAERREESGRPDFTPADAVTHAFVFEVKSTRYGQDLQHLEQVRRYLVEGGRRIKAVVLTNLVAVRIYKLDDDGNAQLTSSIDLVTLLAGSAELAAGLRDATELARFLDGFRFVELNLAQKRERIRIAPEWNPLLEATEPSWLSARLDRTVEILRAEVADRIRDGALFDDATTPAAERPAILQELQELEWRIAADPPEQVTRPLEQYMGARADTDAGKALAQFEAHVAYFTATRLMLVRVWEDLGLLEPVLHDGGFRTWLDRLEGIISEVVDHAYLRAQRKYPSLFERRNTYTWFRPSPDTYVDALYELSNTYLGAIESDVLGAVYERLLERVDRKLLGQYYTPRDVISLIWDLVDADRVSTKAEDEDRGARVLDIATGSGGFLVEVARRMRRRAEGQVDAGAALDLRIWVSRVAKWLIGIEYQRFPAYLAELNLLIQIGLIFKARGDLTIPALGIIWDDTLAYHNRDDLGLVDAGDHVAGQPLDVRLFPEETHEWFDVAIGNPPYVGEKKAGRLLARTRGHFPYWNQYAAAHLDYLYWFLILGISKLGPDGRFGFITTEYWLRAHGARPLRRFLSQNTEIERLLVFRDLRLFPDAPGQHSMVVIGNRRNQARPGRRTRDLPRVSVYDGTNIVDRSAILDAMRDGATRGSLRSFRSVRSPGELGERSWSEVILTPSQVERRTQLRVGDAPLDLLLSEGLVSSADRLTRSDVDQLDARTIAEIGGPAAHPGIFVLAAQELRELGEINDLERSVLKRIINTRDVFPYAAVAPEEGEYLIYLPPGDNPRGGTYDAIRRRPFPTGMPTLERHLRHFEPILLAKTRQYRVRRPWWTIHNHRPLIAAHEGTDPSWAGYALMARWGVGGTLTVGLAPRDTKPASGLHALMSDQVSAAYIVGIVNSSPVQAIADGIPPGMVRQEDLADLGLPLLDAERVAAIAAETTIVAGLVRDTVSLASKWPSLREALRRPGAIAADVESSWLPAVGPPARWGRLGDLGWIEVESSGNLNVPISDVAIETGVFGTTLIASNGARFVRLRLADPNEPMLAALLAYVKGLSIAGRRLENIEDARGPVDSAQLAVALASDLEELRALSAPHGAARARIDAIVREVL